MNPEDIVLDQIEAAQRSSGGGGGGGNNGIANGLEDFADDDFWDHGGSGGIRTSSDADPTKYYDPNNAYKEHDHRSVASFLPSRGPRGVIIPRASRFGRSLGHDPYKPQIVNIDPDIPGQSSVVDLSKVTQESMNEAIATVAAAGLHNPLTAASAAFRQLAIGTKPIEQPGFDKVAEECRQHPLGSGYVVPKALPGGGQAVRVQPSKQFAKPAILKTQPVPHIEKEAPDPLTELEALQIENALLQQAALQRIPALPARAAQARALPPSQAFKQAQAKAAAEEPQELVTYEVDGFGYITMPYHRVVKEDVCLVLAVKKTNFGQQCFPQQSEKPLTVDVHSHDSIYKVLVPGIQFTLDDYDICVLMVTDEAPKS